MDESERGGVIHAEGGLEDDTGVEKRMATETRGRRWGHAG